MLCSLTCEDKLAYITVTVSVYHLKHVTVSVVNCVSAVSRVLSLSPCRRHGSFSGLALRSGRGCFLRSSVAETLFSILLEGLCVSVKCDQVRREAGAVQADIQSVYSAGQVHPAGATYTRQAVCYLRWKRPHLPGHRAAQQQTRQCFPRQSPTEERRLRCLAHEQ